MLTLAQAWMGGGFIHLAILVVIIVSICGIVWVVVKQSGIPIPGWVITIAWILLLAVVAVFAIRFLGSL